MSVFFFLYIRVQGDFFVLFLHKTTLMLYNRLPSVAKIKLMIVYYTNTPAQHRHTIQHYRHIEAQSNTITSRSKSSSMYKNTPRVSHYTHKHTQSALYTHPCIQCTLYTNAISIFAGAYKQPTLYVIYYIHAMSTMKHVL